MALVSPADARSARLADAVPNIVPSAPQDAMFAAAALLGVARSANPLDDCSPSSTAPGDAEAGSPASSVAVAEMTQLGEPRVAQFVRLALVG